MDASVPKAYNDCMHALIVEPSRFMLHVLGSILQEAGFSVDGFTREEELLSALTQGPAADLICLSLLLKKESGLDLTSSIRHSPRGRLVPIVLMTSNEGDQERQQALTAGITEVFFKSDLKSFQDYVRTTFQNQHWTNIQARGILYVEDSPTTARLVASWLEQCSSRVEVFASAEAALEAWRREPEAWDLVLSDFMLQGKMTGLGLVRELRELAGSKLPILITSALEDTARKLEILRSGANDHIAKPVLEEELLARVKLLVQNKQLMDEVEAQRQSLARMALTDSLTRLPNRHALMEEIPPRLKANLASGTACHLAVLDLDHFKEINDRLGHLAGDEILIALAGELRSLAGEHCLVGRFGGEEFLCFMEGISPGKAFNLCEDLRSRLYNLQPDGCHISVSIGLASVEAPTRPDMDFSTLFSLADQAMYKAKDSGRNRVLKAD